MISFFFILISQIQVNAELEKKPAKITVGDPFELKIETYYPAKEKISPPFLDSIGPFKIIDQKNKVYYEKGMARNVYRLQIAAFKTGKLTLPEFKFLHGKDTLRTKSIPLEITSVMPDGMKDINDLKEAVDFPNWLPFIIAAIIGGIAIFGYLVFRLYKKYRRARLEEKPPLPPWIEAIVGIENIPVKEWLEKGWFKKYYYTLSEILKKYLERRFGFNAAEETTSELVRSMKLYRLPLRDEFTRFFTKADMVKYALFVPQMSEMENAITITRELIERTKLTQQKENR